MDQQYQSVVAESVEKQDLIPTQSARSGGCGVKDRNSISICGIVSDTRLVAAARSLV
jgi:hypothetical protein